MSGVMVDVTVKVPTEHLAEFYKRYATWLAELTSGVSPAPGGEPVDWTARDVDLAATVWNQLSVPTRELLLLLLATPGKERLGTELAKALATPNGRAGVAGMLGWPARYARAVGRKNPVETKMAKNEDSAYWMTPAVAALFAAARTKTGKAPQK